MAALRVLIPICLGIVLAADSPCGVSTVQNQIFDENSPRSFVFPEHRIVGGQPTVAHSWPWVVELFFRNSSKCGGALISEDLVLTAAHCLHASRIAKNYAVIVGSHQTGSGQYHRVEALAVHPTFNLVWPSSWDVAVLKITPPVKLSEKASPVCIPTLAPPPFQVCAVAGWGLTQENGTRSQVLQEIHVPVLPANVCNNMAHYGGLVHSPSMFCAGYSQGAIDSCQGDSGGPLMCLRQGKWELQGLVSWGIGCGRPGRPGVYSKISAFWPWIKVTMWKLGGK
ncbi:unnamed protein product, partial [Mesorhabditis spiculigera]